MQLVDNLAMAGNEIGAPLAFEFVDAGDGN